MKLPYAYKVRNLRWAWGITKDTGDKTVLLKHGTSWTRQGAARKVRKAMKTENE